MNPTELSSEEIAEIREAAAHYEDKSAAAIEALQIVQQHRGWVSDAALAAAAELLQVAPAQLEAVATFYNLIYRRPVGRRVIHYCTSVSCWMLGAEQVRDSLCRRLGVQPGEISADGEFTLLPIVCLGACDHAPVVMVGDEYFLDVNDDNADAMLKKEPRNG